MENLGNYITRVHDEINVNLDQYVKDTGLDYGAAAMNFTVVLSAIPYYDIKVSEDRYELQPVFSIDFNNIMFDKQTQLDFNASEGVWYMGDERPIAIAGIDANWAWNIKRFVEKRGLVCPKEIVNIIKKEIE